MNRLAYECVVCTEVIRAHHEIWSCATCYRMFHLTCVRRWRETSLRGSSWRCPGCQAEQSSTLVEAVCFCGKTLNPPSRPGVLAHSCGEVCGRPLAKFTLAGSARSTCPHSCTLLCHPVCGWDLPAHDERALFGEKEMGGLVERSQLKQRLYEARAQCTSTDPPLVSPPQHRFSAAGVFTAPLPRLLPLYP